MKILFLTNLLPYPLDNGGKIKTYSTLKALTNAGHDIDLLCFREVNDEKNTECLKNILGCKNIYEVNHKLTTSIYLKYMMFIAIMSIFSKYSFGIYKYNSMKMKKLIISLLQNNNYDCVYYDHLQMFLYDNIVRSKKHSIKSVLDEHNCEYLIMERNYYNTSNLFKKAFLKLETFKLKKFEISALKSVNKVIFLSEEDKEEFSKLIDFNINTSIIPIGIETPREMIEYEYKDLDCVSILFVGTLSWAPNNDGLIWFLRNVAPKINEKCCEFRITVVGKNPSRELLDISERYKNMNITGYVESVIPFYREADFMIVPLFVGSGQRVKIIEGFSYGIPIISTTIGAEGLEYKEQENILIANNENEFLEKINMMKNGGLRKKLSKNAKTTFDKYYSINAVEQKIQNVISDL